MSTEIFRHRYTDILVGGGGARRYTGTRTTWVVAELSSVRSRATPDLASHAASSNRSHKTTDCTAITTIDNHNQPVRYFCNLSDIGDRVRNISWQTLTVTVTLTIYIHIHIQGRLGLTGCRNSERRITENYYLHFVA